MARERNPKQTEKPTVTLEELPRGAEELTNEEAEATQGGLLQDLSPAQKAQLLKSTGTTPEGQTFSDALTPRSIRPK